MSVKGTTVGYIGATRTVRLTDNGELPTYACSRTIRWQHKARWTSLPQYPKTVRLHHFGCKKKHFGCKKNCNAYVGENKDIDRVITVVYFQTI